MGMKKKTKWVVTLAETGSAPEYIVSAQTRSEARKKVRAGKGKYIGTFFYQIERDLIRKWEE